MDKKRTRKSGARFTGELHLRQRTHQKAHHWRMKIYFWQLPVTFLFGNSYVLRSRMLLTTD